MNQLSNKLMIHFLLFIWLINFIVSALEIVKEPSTANCVIVLFIFVHVCYIFNDRVFSVVGLDIQDEMGRHEVGHIDNSMKIPLNQGDGCRFEGEFTINKVRPHHIVEWRRRVTHAHTVWVFIWLIPFRERQGFCVIVIPLWWIW